MLYSSQTFSPEWSLYDNLGVSYKASLITTNNYDMALQRLLKEQHPNVLLAISFSVCVLKVPTCSINEYITLS